jgi:transposase
MPVDSQTASGDSILINLLGPDRTGTVASVMIDVDLPSGVEITGYERHHDGHGFEVRWPLPERGRCERCGHEDRAYIEYKTSPQAVRDLDVWGQPSFWIYQAPFHRCARCDYRQHIIPPFKRKDMAYTFRFEQFVLRSLIGSTAEDVARRLGISAETVERIVENQLDEDRRIDPQRVITDIGLDELSLKKRHRLYVTLLTPDLKELHQIRLRFQEIFDTAPNRRTAARWLRELRRKAEVLGLDFSPFFATYDRWKTEILNYFDARQTSAAVEGINTKARVITKRTYGLKSAESLWSRLILDLNRASEAIGWTIDQIRRMARGLKALFDPSRT